MYFAGGVLLKPEGLNVLHREREGITRQVNARWIVSRSRTMDRCTSFTVNHSILKGREPATAIPRDIKREGLRYEVMYNKFVITMCMSRDI